MKHTGYKDDADTQSEFLKSLQRSVIIFKWHLEAISFIFCWFNSFPAHYPLSRTQRSNDDDDDKHIKTSAQPGTEEDVMNRNSCIICLCLVVDFTHGLCRFHLSGHIKT